MIEGSHLRPDVIGKDHQVQEEHHAPHTEALQLSYLQQMGILYPIEVQGTQEGDG